MSLISPSTYLRNCIYISALIVLSLKSNRTVTFILDLMLEWVTHVLFTFAYILLTSCCGLRQLGVRSPHT